MNAPVMATGPAPGTATDLPAGAPPPAAGTHATWCDVAGMLADEYEAIHGPLPAGWPRCTGTDEPPPDDTPPADDDLDRRLQAFYALVHALPERVGRSALCLSGGGIRSAAFSLGVLQALARAGVLQRFHYLSTVSGGGYIGSWLTAWIHRYFTETPSTNARGQALPRRERLGHVAARLASRAGVDALGGDRPPEPQQVAHLRRFTNYLSPHPGAFSLDTWTLAAVYVRNLLLNWTVVVPLLVTALTAPILVAGLVMTAGGVDFDAGRLAAVAVPAGAALLVWLGIVVMTVVRRPFARVGVAERWSRAEGQVIRVGVSWLLFAVLVLYARELVDSAAGLVSIATAGGASGVATVVLKKLGDRRRREASEGGGPPRLVRMATIGTALLSILAILTALSLLAAGLVRWTAAEIVLPSPAGPLMPVLAPVLVILAGLAASAAAATVVDINEFSLHALYRNRLVRAFLRASRGDDAPASDTAFDEGDDLPLATLWPRHGPSGESPDDAPHLFHVINATLNDLGGTRPEWNDRKGVSFTFSPLHAGAHIAGRYREASGTSRGGYRRLREPDGPPSPLGLGTAMSISGAAASPNMGYHSSPVVTFLMALFNVRLGWWMLPPWHGDTAPAVRGPMAVWRAWWAEAFGGTRFTASVLNVSDGGHFDNLGLYEMIRRRCRYIVVVDAGQDAGGTFESLAEALRRIRVDFGVPITMTGLDLSERAATAPAPPAWYGTIHYSRADRRIDGDHRVADGTLVYFRPVVSGGEPVDVQSYRRLHRAFPHETTVDQWFSEAQFESYRALGEHTVQHLLGYYHAIKGQPRPTAAPAGVPTRTPQDFCHQIAEAIGLMRRHREASSHAGGVVYRRSRGGIEFLLVRSTDHLHRILPKGHIEPWEDAVTTAIREVREEAGLTLAPARSLGVSSFETRTRKVTTTYFLMDEVSGTPSDWSQPHEDYRAPAWFTIATARTADLPVPDDVIRVLEKAEQLIPSHAGGVVFRRGDGRIEFLLVRSRDQSCRVLPKGHVEPGERMPDAAVREVEEEAGYGLRPGPCLGVFDYTARGERVSTAYYLMDAGAATRAGGGEERHRDPRWFTLDAIEAADLPVADGVRQVLEEATRALAPEG